MLDKDDMDEEAAETSVATILLFRIAKFLEAGIGTEPLRTVERSLAS